MIPRKDIIMIKLFKYLSLPLVSLLLASCSSTNESNAPVAKPSQSSSVENHEDTHTHPRGDGLVSTAQGVSLELKNSDLKVGDNKLEFTLKRMNELIDTYTIVHEKPIHMVIVDKTLGSFQHLHPTMGKDFIWSVDVNFTNSGQYKVYTDFTLEEGGTDVNYVLSADANVAGSNELNFVLPEPAESVIVDGYNVAVSGSVSAENHTMLMFTVLDSTGNPVTFDNYLGSTGHLIAIRDGDMAMAHMHNSDHTAHATSGHSSTTSMPGMLHFDAEFPSGAGKYRLFLEFVVGGKKMLATFTSNVI